MQRKKAPKWVMMGLLILFFICALISVLYFLNILPVTQISFIDEYNQSLAISYINVWWITKALSIFLFGSVAVFSIMRKWKKVITVSSLILVTLSFFEIVYFLLETSVTNYYELYTYMSLRPIIGLIQLIVYLIGILMLIWNINISKIIRIATVAYVLLINVSEKLFPYLEIQDGDLYLSLANPILVISLMGLYFYPHNENN